MKFFCSGYFCWATEDTTINESLLKKEREIFFPLFFLCIRIYYRLTVLKGFSPCNAFSEINLSCLFYQRPEYKRGISYHLLEPGLTVLLPVKEALSSLVLYSDRIKHFLLQNYIATIVLKRHITFHLSPKISFGNILRYFPK
jgi:hypothetical protein